MKWITKENLATVFGAVLGSAAVSCCFMAFGGKSENKAFLTTSGTEISARAAQAGRVLTQPEVERLARATQKKKLADEAAAKEEDPLDPSASGVWAISSDGEALAVNERVQGAGERPLLPTPAARLTLPTNRAISLSLRETGETRNAALDQVGVLGDGAQAWSIQSSGEKGEEIRGLLFRLKDGERRSVMVFLDGVKKPVAILVEGNSRENATRHKSIQLDFERVGGAASGGASESSQKENAML